MCWGIQDDRAPPLFTPDRATSSTVTPASDWGVSWRQAPSQWGLVFRASEGVSGQGPTLPAVTARVNSAYIDVAFGGEPNDGLPFTVDRQRSRSALPDSAAVLSAWPAPS